MPRSTVRIGLVGESLQPQDPRQREPCDHSLVELKAHDVRAVRGSNVALQHALGVAARPRLLSEEVEGDAHQPIADERVGGIARLRRHGAKLLRKPHPLARAPVVHVTAPESPQRTQLMVGVLESLGQLQRGRPGRTRLALGPRRAHQRPAERRLQLHLGAGVAPRSRGERRQRALDPRPTLAEQGTLKPERHRGDRQRDTEGRVSPGGERPIERRAQIIERRAVRGQPLGGRLGVPLRVRAFEEITVILGMAPRAALDLAALGELLAGVGARRFEQPIRRDGAAEIDRDQ